MTRRTRRTRNRNSALFAGLMLLAMLAGCSKKDKPPETAKKAQQAAPVAQPVAPVQKQLSSAAKGGTQLDFKNRTDPFRAPVPEAAPPDRAARPGAPLRPAADLLPIQSFEVSKFKVAGIITGLKENRALVLDPLGKGYVVQVGMPIGNNGGRIAAITASTVEVVENFKDDSGRSRKRRVVLTLAKKR